MLTQSQKLIRTHIHNNQNECTYVYSHNCTLTHVHTNVHVHTHTHTHTQGSKLDTLVKNEGDAEDSFVLKDTEGNLVLALRFVLQFPGNLDFAEAQQVSTCDRR